MRNLLSDIEVRMPTFSKGQKLISNYILENYDKAAYMTASKLGKIVQVSESTVVRFAIEPFPTNMILSGISIKLAQRFSIAVFSKNLIFFI